MTLRITRKGLSQQGFVKASQIPYLLLALAVLALLFFWNTVRSKDSQIAELQQSKDTEIAKLEAKIQTDGAAMSELQSTHVALQADHKALETETIPALKSDLSLARAQNQRAKHVSDARDNLQTALQSAKASNQNLTRQVKVLPQLKRDLSFANAANQRSQHTTAARENLIARLKNVQGENRELAMQLQQAGAATTESQPLVQSNEATGKMMAEIQTLKGANEHLADRLVDRLFVISNLKRDLSFANAENQRAVHVQTARDNLIGQLHETKQEQATLSSLASQLPDLKKQLSMANAENARLRHVSNARDRLMAQGRELQATAKTN